MATAVNDNGTLNQVSSLWKLLDKMSTTNPGEYKKFINQVIDEGKENNMGPPVPKLCVLTLKIPKVIPNRKYFINISEWRQIPPAKSKTDSVPILASDAREETINKEVSMVIDVVLNPKVFEKQSPSYLDVPSLIEMVLQYIESRNSIKMSREYEILKETYMGNQDYLLNFICPSSLKDSISNLEKNSKGNALFEKVKMSTELNSNESDKNEKKRSTNEAPEYIEGLTQNVIITGNSTNNIKEIKSKKLKKANQSTTTTKLTKPQVEMFLNKKDIEFKIYLHNVVSVKECDLNLTEISIDLLVKEKYELHLPLPLAIDVDRSSAKFLKDEEVLCVRSILK